MKVKILIVFLINFIQPHLLRLSNKTPFRANHLIQHELNRARHMLATHLNREGASDELSYTACAASDEIETGFSKTIL